MKLLNQFLNIINQEGIVVDNSNLPSFTTQLTPGIYDVSGSNNYPGCVSTKQIH